MDTNPYSNIMKAVDGESAKPFQNPTLTPSQQMDNYNAFSQLQKEGVYLPDLMKRITALESKVKSYDESKREADADLFAVMEASVKNEPVVKEARQRVADEKSRIIVELCQRDERYRNAVEEYRRTVNAEYIRQKEPQKDRGRTSQVCQDSQGGLSHKASLSRSKAV